MAGDFSFSELQEWRRNEAPDWLQDTIDDYNLTWEAAWELDPLHNEGMQAVDEWESVRIDADSADSWELTFTFADGSSETIDYGDDWGAAWDTFDLAHELDYVDDERGEVDYDDD